MATTRKTTKESAGGRSRAGTPAQAVPPADGHSTLVDLAQQLRSWTDTVLGIAGAAADVDHGRGEDDAARSPGSAPALEKTGAVLRRMRESAGLCIDEVGKAIDLKDPALLELVENGKVALPFEIILRLAAVLGRNDPISFVMRFTRSYNPDVWKTLEALGIGRLALQAGREREFANLYRASDAARRLPDEDFAEVLAFTQGRVRDGARVPRGQDGEGRRRARRRRRTADDCPASRRRRARGRPPRGSPADARHGRSPRASLASMSSRQGMMSVMAVDDVMRAALVHPRVGGLAHALLVGLRHLLPVLQRRGRSRCR